MSTKVTKMSKTAQETMDRRILTPTRFPITPLEANAVKHTILISIAELQNAPTLSKNHLHVAGTEFLTQNST
jgi:hypothetical protein